MTALGQAKKNNYHLLELEHGDPASPSYVYLTDWSGGSSYASKTWVATPGLEFTFPANVGTLEEETLRIKTRESVSSLLTSLVSGTPLAPVYATVTRVTASLTDDPGATQYHVIAKRMRVTRAAKNPDGKNGLVRLTAVSPKSQLRVPLGMAANVACGWVLFGRGCGLTPISSTGTLTAIDATDSQKVTITGLASAASLAPGPTPGKFWHRGYVKRQGVIVEIRDWNSAAATTFYLVRRPPASWVGQTVTVFPGCPKTLVEGCRNRFNNEAKFAGTGFAIPARHIVHEIS